jgi:hypothetical protein
MQGAMTATADLGPAAEAPRSHRNFKTAGEHGWRRASAATARRCSIGCLGIEADVPGMAAQTLQEKSKANSLMHHTFLAPTSDDEKLVSTYRRAVLALSLSARRQFWCTANFATFIAAIR